MIINQLVSWRSEPSQSLRIMSGLMIIKVLSSLTKESEICESTSESKDRVIKKEKEEKKNQSVDLKELERSLCKLCSCPQAVNIAIE